MDKARRKKGKVVITTLGCNGDLEIPSMMQLSIWQKG
jgi:hypothetical protein